MRIGIHADALATPFPCGTKVYSENLIKSLAKIDTQNTYYIFVTGGVRIPLANNFHFVDIPNIPIFKRQLLLPILVKKYKLNVFHFLEPYGSIFLNHPNIVTTVHDLDLSGTYPLLSRDFITRFFCTLERKFVFTNTNRYISVSKTITKELEVFLDCGSKRPIETIYEAAENFFKISGGENRTGKYYLAMGDFAPRKNIITTIKAYSSLPWRVRNKYPLKIIASTNCSAEKFRLFASKTKAISNIKIMVNISKHKLITLYKKALVFVFPSLYEGFGLPILEAMACGCPVITSNYGAMKEVAGKAAIFVNPNSVISVERAMTKIIGNTKLRSSLINKGRVRARRFSWEKTAKETLRIYEKH